MKCDIGKAGVECVGVMRQVLFGTRFIGIDIFFFPAFFCLFCFRYALNNLAFGSLQIGEEINEGEKERKIVLPLIAFALIN